MSPQAQTVALPKRWPLVNTLNNRSSNFLKDARLVNAFAEKDRATGEYQVEKRPGFGLLPEISVPNGPGQGVYTTFYFNAGFSAPNAGYVAQTVIVAGSIAYSLFTNANGLSPPPYSFESMGAINVNTIGNRPGKIQFLSVEVSAGTPPIILFGSGATVEGGPPGALAPVAYYMTAGIPILSTLTPGTNNFPYLTVPGFVYLDGYTYVMDIGGTIWQTATQNQVTNWSNTAYISAQSDSDLGVQLARQLIYVVAIKQWTTQFFYDAGNATGSSLSPVPGALFNVGCLSSDTFAELDGELFWATQSKQGTYEIVQVVNLQLTVISTPGVERQLDLGPGGMFYALAYQHAGHRFYIITNTVTNVTMVYDIGEKLWHLWTDYQGNFYPVCARTVDPDGNEWHQMAATGNVYEMKADYEYPNDSGNIVPVDIYTPNFDAGTDRGKALNMLFVNADQTPGSELYLRCSDDDYTNWTNFRKVDLGRRPPRTLPMCGSFVRRAYHLRHYANTPLRIRSLGLQLDLCTL